MSADPTPQPADFLHAHDVCRWLTKNMEIHFQTDGETWNRDRAVLHFKKREALLIVQKALLDAGERGFPPANPT
jgi:hypothetical protein